MDYDIKNQPIPMQNLNQNHQLPYMSQTSSIVSSMTNSFQFNNGLSSNGNNIALFNNNNSMFNSINYGMANNNIVASKQPQQYYNFTQSISKNTQPKNET